MLDLDDVKLHLRVDGAYDDDLIESLMTAATAVCAHHLDVLPATLTSTTPAAIKSAAMLLIGSLYENREMTADRAQHINPTFSMLLQPYRVMTA